MFFILCQQRWCLTFSYLFPPITHKSRPVFASFFSPHLRSKIRKRKRRGMFDLIDWLFFSSCCCCCSGLESDSSPSSSSSSGSADHPRGVRPVYLRCSQGSVAWLYPRGALRVVLRYGTAGKEFQVNNTHTLTHSNFFFFFLCVSRK